MKLALGPGAAAASGNKRRPDGPEHPATAAARFLEAGSFERVGLN